MARPRKNAAVDGEILQDAPEQSESSISADLADLIAQESPGQRRAALEAILTALQEVKHRAASSAAHLGDDHADLLERIRAL